MVSWVERQDANRRRGDKLEVRLTDNTFNRYYEKSIHVERKAEWELLLDDLKNLGIDVRKISQGEKRRLKDDRWW